MSTNESFYRQLSELLARLEQQAPSDMAPVQGTGRTAELRRKYAAMLGDGTRRALRPPVSQADLRRLADSFAPMPLPTEVTALYAVANGEVSEGLFLPDLTFLPAETAAKLCGGNRSIADEGTVGDVLEAGLPLFGIATGDQILLVPGATEGSGIYYINANDYTATRIGSELTGFIRRVVEMHEGNRAAGRIVFRGDLDSFGELERQ
jgi:hypothetical protein